MFRVLNKIFKKNSNSTTNLSELTLDNINIAPEPMHSIKEDNDIKLCLEFEQQLDNYYTDNIINRILIKLAVTIFNKHEYTDFIIFWRLKRKELIKNQLQLCSLVKYDPLYEYIFAQEMYEQWVLTQPIYDIPKYNYKPANSELANHHDSPKNIYMPMRNKFIIPVTTSNKLKKFTRHFI